MAQRHIVQLSKFYPPEWGGIETVARDLSTGFAAAGFESTVVAFTRGQSRRERLDGVDVVRCAARRSLLSQPLSLGWLMHAFRFGTRADVILIQWPNLLPTLLVPFWRRKKIIVFWQSDLIEKGLLAKLVWPLQWLLLRRATWIWTSTGDYIDGSPVIRKFRHKASALPIGIHDPSTSEASDELPAKISSFLNGREFVLAVGRLVPYKGFDQLIAAAGSINPGRAIVIVGEGPLEAELRRSLIAAGVQDRVLLAGRVDQATLTALFKSASVYVMSSNQRSEAFGVVQVEAMAHSLPIVATDVPASGVAWVSGHGATGAVVPINDPKAIASAVNRILDSPDRARLGKAARSRYEEEFTASIMIERATAIIDRICPAGAEPTDPRTGIGPGT